MRRWLRSVWTVSDKWWLHSRESLPEVLLRFQLQPHCLSYQWAGVSPYALHHWIRCTHSPSSGPYGSCTELVAVDGGGGGGGGMSANPLHISIRISFVGVTWQTWCYSDQHTRMKVKTKPHYVYAKMSDCHTLHLNAVELSGMKKLRKYILLDIILGHSICHNNQICVLWGVIAPAHPQAALYYYTLISPFKAL